MFYLYRTLQNAHIETYKAFELLEEAQAHFKQAVAKYPHMISYRRICEDGGKGGYKHIGECQTSKFIKHNGSIGEVLVRDGAHILVKFDHGSFVFSLPSIKIENRIGDW